VIVAKQGPKRLLRRHQLGLIVIGMLCSTRESREYIRTKLAIKAVKPSGVQQCLAAIRDKDVGHIQQFFGRFGVDFSGRTLAEAIVERVHDDYEQDMLMQTFSMIMAGDRPDIDDIEKQLEVALALVRNVKAGVIKQTLENEDGRRQDIRQQRDRQQEQEEGAAKAS
jgi:hypothetical protein